MADGTEDLDFFDSDIEKYTKKYGSGTSDIEDTDFIDELFESSDGSPVKDWSMDDINRLIDEVDSRDDVEEAGEYYFDLSYGHGYGDTDAASKTTIWIDDEILTQDMKLPGDSWSKLREIQLGKKHLEPGKHTFKIMVQVNGFYIDAWRFHDGREYEKKEFDGYLGNELGYDEGVIK